MADVKQYMIDTNAVRYQVNPTPDIKKPTRRFWQRVIAEVENGEAVLLVPDEVVRELGIHSIGFEAQRNKRELNNISDLLGYCEEVPSYTNAQIEHQIRRMAAHIRGHFKGDIDCGKGVEYPSVSDARILFTAWQKECTLVTANIKDFMLLPVIDPSEEALYDILSGNYISISEEAQEKIYSDATFKKMLKELADLVETSESET